ncbi:hypothetical protein NDU88_004566 [Pleurodeles waltl]|uniref:Uncharacterized protein n=1 Tax=Pleurodeles waltl TaxID=8319 RepID=A0AAV7M6P1_PLEWA|nr:hypothetical protein NDU88_004566 [Pleurodeles waltl]
MVVLGGVRPPPLMTGGFAAAHEPCGAGIPRGRLGDIGRVAGPADAPWIGESDRGRCCRGLETVPIAGVDEGCQPGPIFSWRSTLALVGGGWCA